ncbi:unnamed protein product [Caenorhabditis auriculariae]|uniref:Uncharacterized protein n=1 Tax=Caenorhabditis auriculariae TaxID=2777116 RepID=A0A8S1HP04_9PELO|nr:unnamed protein product [Caenorhabditis auriculariae]
MSEDYKKAYFSPKKGLGIEKKKKTFRSFRMRNSEMLLDAQKQIGLKVLKSRLNVLLLNGGADFFPYFSAKQPFFWMLTIVVGVREFTEVGRK